MKKIEILAPAGSREAMEAAIEAGCDALYIGGSSFGARAYADNLSEAELLEAIDDVHLHGKSLYLTVNTLLKERELQGQLYRYIERFYEQGLDAAIVQDMGVLRFLHTHFPDLPLHASTQMTITSADALTVLKGSGVTRIVTSRELTLAEIKELRSQTELQIESFVHGALCYCYSGQCLFASMSGGRSGNRGRCTQPCRMEYQVWQENGTRLDVPPYVLSPKDICTLDHIPELIEAGIDSFKIEGRMKRPEYAALTTALYRKWTDRYLALGAEGYQEYQRQNPEEMPEDIRKLADLYNRGGFSGGYYHQRNGTSMMSMERPNHYGVKAVSVEAVEKHTMKLRALLPLAAQDVLEIRRNGKTEYEFTLKSAIESGTIFSANFLPGSRIRPGMTGYRTKNAALLGEIQERFLKTRRKLPIKGHFYAEAGKPIQLSLWVESGQELPTGEAVCYGCEAEPAKKQPLTAERVEQALKKTGESRYEWSGLQIELKGALFFPVSALNALRREGIKQLEANLLQTYRRALPQPVRPAVSKKQLDLPFRFLSAGMERKEQLTPLLQAISLSRIYLSFQAMTAGEMLSAIRQIKAEGKEAYIRFPRIFRAETRRRLEQEKDTIEAVLERADGVLLHTLEEVGWLEKKRIKTDIILGENLYTWNEEARHFWRERGISHFTSPLELTKGELADLDLREDELIIYGYQPVMVSAQCLQKNVQGCQKEPALLFLKDKKERRFPVINVCPLCYTIYYHQEPLNLTRASEELKQLSIRRLRFDFTIEDKEEVRRVLTAWERREELLEGGEGHFRLGVE